MALSSFPHLSADLQSATTYSMFDPFYLAALIGRVYGFQQVRCQLIKATVRDTYQVWADHQQFIFYVYRHQPRSKPEIEAEIMWIEHLVTHGLPVARAVPVKNREYLVTLDAPEGTRQAALFEFAAGHALSKQPSPQTAYQCGRLVAQLHQIELPDHLHRPRLDFQTLIGESLRAFAAAAPHRHNDLDTLQRAAGALEKRFPDTDASYGLIHGDIIPSNILLDEQDQPLLIDFDSCGYGWHLYDVATFLVEADYWNMGEPVKSAFVRGYQSYGQPVVDEDTLNLMQAVRLIWSLGVPAWYINTWGRIYFSDTIINKQIHMLQSIMAALH